MPWAHDSSSGAVYQPHSSSSSPWSQSSSPLHTKSFEMQPPLLRQWYWWGRHASLCERKMKVTFSEAWMTKVWHSYWRGWLYWPWGTKTNPVKRGAPGSLLLRQDLPRGMKIRITRVKQGSTTLTSILRTSNPSPAEQPLSLKLMKLKMLASSCHLPATYFSGPVQQFRKFIKPFTSCKSCGLGHFSVFIYSLPQNFTPKSNWGKKPKSCQGSDVFHPSCTSASVPHLPEVNNQNHYIRCTSLPKTTRQKLSSKFIAIWENIFAILLSSMSYKIYPPLFFLFLRWYGTCLSFTIHVLWKCERFSISFISVH